jgi:ferric-dicitrate binding protein FerR (iron transport regulator)
MQLIPARCERSREWASLRLDGQLSTFETALLDRHLRRCSACRAFAEAATVQTQLLRSAPLEEPLRGVTLPERSSRPVRRGAAGALGALVAAAAAAAVLFSPSSPSPTATTAARTRATNSPQLFVFAARPSPTASVDVPRLRVEPATFADGPTHGIYSLPA